MSRADRQPIARADIEDDLSGILVERNETRVGAAATGIDVHIVAEQRDAMQALRVDTLYLGINFQINLGFSSLTSNFQYCWYWLPTYMKPSSTSGVKYWFPLLGRSGSLSAAMNLTFRSATLPLLIWVRAE